MPFDLLNPPAWLVEWRTRTGGDFGTTYNADNGPITTVTVSLNGRDESEAIALADGPLTERQVRAAFDKVLARLDDPAPKQG